MYTSLALHVVHYADVTWEGCTDNQQSWDNFIFKQERLLLEASTELVIKK